MSDESEGSGSENNSDSSTSEQKTMASSVENKIIILESKKNVLFQRVQRTYDDSKNLTDLKVKQNFLIRIQTLDKTVTEFSELLDQIALLKLQLNPPQESKFQELDVIDELYNHIRYAYEATKPLSETAGPSHRQSGIYSSTSNETKQSSEGKTKSHIRLPKLDLPHFSGLQKEWGVFYEAFLHIHNHPNLTTSDKLRYLLSKLSNKALSIVSGFQPTENNYELIWNTLVERYQDKRTVGSYYLQQILEFKPLEKETSVGLEEFMQKVLSSFEALKNLQIPDLVEFIFLYIALSKLDKTTSRAFEMLERNQEIPNLASFTKFIKEQIKVLSRARKEKDYNTEKRGPHSFVVSKSSSSKKNTCYLHPDEYHAIYRCPVFRKHSVSERLAIVKEKRLCSLCLKRGHDSSVCRSSYKCNICKQSHNILLHPQTPPTQSPPNKSLNVVNDSTLDEATVHCYTNCKEKKNTVVLSTALVNVFDKWGHPHHVRALLDSASQSDFISDKLFDKLGLPSKKVESSISGIGTIKKTMHHQACISFSSRFNLNNKFQIEPFLINKITERLPSHEVISACLSEFEDLALADQEHNNLENIDLLLGASMFATLLRSEKRVSQKFPLTALETELGYVLLGKVPIPNDNVLLANLSIDSDEYTDLDQSVQQFWELEKVPEICNSQEGQLNDEDAICENIFVKNVQRLDSGRFSVALPFKEPLESIGSSLEACKKRFFMLEKRLNNDLTLRKEYSSCMKEYLTLGHMSLIGTPVDAYYLPHFPVVKMDRATTKVRIVYDASQKGTTGKSLNDILFTGAKLQTDLTSILVGFRLAAVAITADVKQMYRQVEVHAKHREAQKILWRFSPEDELQAWALNTVTFGLKPAPFLALRVLKQMISEHQDQFPHAAETAMRDMFIDDLVSSVNDYESAIMLYEELTALFKTGQFDLVKWSSNCKELMTHIPKELHFPEVVEFQDGNHIKVLGLQWCAQSDNLSFKVQVPKHKSSKRNILSMLARIFDPLGFLAPVTITIKLIIQALWKIKLEWDDPVPSSIQKEWEELREELKVLEAIKIPRNLHLSSCSVDIIGFSDASIKGYGAVVYARISTSSEEVETNIVCAKSKVAPLTNVTIPRLELAAAVVLAKLLKFIIHCCINRVSINHVWAFSDSEVVLHWITNVDHKWPVYIENRVQTIRQSVTNAHWAHVKGKENPADLISRGIRPSQLINNTLWFKGPIWLCESPSSWSEFSKSSPSVNAVNIYNVSTDTPVSSDPVRHLIDRHSNYRKLLHIMVYILRFIGKLSTTDSLMSVKNLKKAEMELIKRVQRTHYKKDIDCLLNGKECSNSLKKLNPFVYEGILRVGGRITYANLSYDQKHPILLPKKDHFVKLLVEDIHKNNMHTGPNLVLSLLRNNYWIVDGKQVVRSILRGCNYCFRFSPKSTISFMGNLPAARMRQVKPFYETGVDYAGPFTIVQHRQRGNKVLKAYICLFICMSVKAIHLELVSDLSTCMFLAAFKRFLARRGPCSKMYSDCGTNFKGANAQLQKLYSFTQDDNFNKAVNEELSHQKIEWVYNPALAPHFGGLWESNVKSVKTHLFKVLNDQILTYEELNTVLVQIEALLNSRPLGLLSSDPADPSPLTPAHFFLQQDLSDLLIEPVAEIPSNRLSHYQLLDKLVLSFWTRWRNEYLHTLQAREKWSSKSENLKEGTVVLMKNEHLPPLRWPLAVIEKVYPGKDGIVRVVTLRNKKGTYRRSVMSVCPLPTQ